MEQVIFEKNYREDRDAAMREISLTEKLTSPSMNFADFMNDYYKDLTYILLPDRRAKAQRFILTAKRSCETYQVYTKITRHFSHISVELGFPSSGCMGFLKRLFVMADDITFFSDTKGYEILVILDCYTHAVYHNGIRSMPDNE